MSFTPTYKDVTHSFKHIEDMIKEQEMWVVIKYRLTYKERNIRDGKQVLDFLGSTLIQQRGVMDYDKLKATIYNKGVKLNKLMEPDVCPFDATNNVEFTREIVGITMNVPNTPRSIQVDMKTV